jgi:hypothetical protein
MRSSVIPRRDFSVGAIGRLKNLHCSTTKLTTTTLAAHNVAAESRARRNGSAGANVILISSANFRASSVVTM